MDTKHKSILQKVKPRKILLPILLGFGFGIFIFIKEDATTSLSQIHFTSTMLIGLVFAVLMMLARDIGYIIRLKILSDGELSWIQATRIIFLWEFASAVTPSAVGGTSVALLFLYKEGISIGKGTTIILATSFLDEIYFVFMFPIIIFTVGIENLFGQEVNVHPMYLLHNKYVWFAIIGYSIKFIYTLFISYGLFINPKTFKSILVSIFKLPLLKKWRLKVNQSGDEIIEASKQLQKRDAKFWVKTVLSTFFSWTARYWVANFIIIAIIFSIHNHQTSDINWIEQTLIFAKQLVMWIMMMVMPTPGGSGISEIIFSDYMKDFIPNGFSGIIALIWRLISYYPYLIIGAMILPGWINKFMRPKKS